MPLKVLVISHPAVAPAYRRKFELVREYGDLRLIVPEAWHEESRLVRFDPATSQDWTVALPIVWEGYYTRYFYKGGLRRQFLDFQPDLIHMEEEPYSLSAGQIVHLANRLAPSAKFIFRTSISTDIRLKAVARPLLRWIEQRTFRRTDCAFVLSPHAEEIMRLHGYRGPTRVFPNGIRTDLFKPLGEEVRQRRRMGLGVGDAFLIGYVGRLDRLKGIETLMEATAAMPDSRLLIVGEGPHRAKLESMRDELGLIDRAAMIGSKPPEEVAEYLNAMDVFVLPSRTSPLWVEFFGRVLVEAMACGTPTVGSSSGEIPRTVGDSGLIFPEGDANALVETLREIQTDPSIAETLRVKGFARVHENFAWEVIARNTVTAYEDIMRGDS